MTETCEEGSYRGTLVDPPVFCPHTGVRVLFDATAIRMFLEDPVTYWLSCNQGWRMAGDNPRFIWGHLREWVELMLWKWRAESGADATDATEVWESFRPFLIAHPDFERLRACECAIGPNRMTADRLLAATETWIRAFWNRLPEVDQVVAIEQKFLQPMEIFTRIDTDNGLRVYPRTQVFTAGSFDAIVLDPLDEGKQEVNEFKATSVPVTTWKIKEYSRSIQGRMYQWMAGHAGISVVRWNIWDISKDPMKVQVHRQAVNESTNNTFDHWLHATIISIIDFEREIRSRPHKLANRLSIPTVSKDWRDLLVNHDPRDWDDLLHERCVQGPAWDPLRRSG